MGDQRHSPAVLLTGKRSDTHCTGDWVGLGAGLDGSEKSHLQEVRGLERETLPATLSYHGRQSSTKFNLLPFRQSTSYYIWSPPPPPPQKIFQFHPGVYIYICRAVHRFLFKTWNNDGIPKDSVDRGYHYTGPNGDPEKRGRRSNRYVNKRYTSFCKWLNNVATSFLLTKRLLLIQRRMHGHLYILR